MIDKRVADGAAALAGLEDGATVMISGFGGAGAPVALMRALADETTARDIALVVNSVRALEENAPRMFEERRVKRAVCSAFRGRGQEPSRFERQWQAGELEIEICPQGAFAERIRCGGAGIAAYWAATGVGGPLAAGKETRVFDGVECVLETALKGDFALFRAAEADRMGNVRFHGSQANFAPAMAAAARVAVVEVAQYTTTPLPPERIHLSGVYVDRVLVDPGKA